MDYAQWSVDELKNGVRREAETDSYVCLACGRQFPAEQVYPFGDQFFLAEHAAKRHIADEHGGAAAVLIHSDTKYNTLTETQKDLLLRLASGATDREIARALGISEATVRRQRFNFREKAKQAKLYLAQYGQVFTADREELIPIHNQAAFVDDRYVITGQEREKILKTSFACLNPLVLKSFPPKEKKKVVILTAIAAQFQRNMRYSEREVNEILQPIYPDYAAIRRYLISYGLMSRTRSGSEYWLTE
jgi:transposase-like protein